MSETTHPPSPHADGRRGSSQPVYWLEDERGRRHYITGAATVGRAPSSDVRLSSPLVSRYHALLRFSTGQWGLLDLDSTNGTTVNGQRVTELRAVRPGDVIAFADARFIFSSDAEPLGATGGPGPEVTPVLQTPHARLWAAAGSFAEEQREAIGERVEQGWGALRDLLALPGLDAPLQVYLLDDLAASPRRDGAQAAGGYADPATRAVYTVYRPDAPGVDLERGLLEIAAHLALDGAALPPPVAGGVLLLVQQRSGSGMSAEQVTSAVTEAAGQGLVPPLAQLLTQGTGDAQRDAVAVGGLLGFLLAAWSPARVADFLRALPGGNPDAAARAAFGVALGSIEKRWRRSLRRGAPQGVRLFLSLMRPYLRPYRLKLAEVALYLLLSVLFGVGLARAQGYLLDEALIPGDRRVFAIVMSALVAAFVVVNLASVRENYLRAWVSERVLRDLRLRMFSRVQEMHPGFFHEADSGDLLARMTSDLYMVEAALTTGMIESLRLGFMFVAALVMVLVVDWRLALVALVGAPIFFLIGRLLGPRIARASIERQAQFGVVTGTIHENLAAQPVVKLYGLERREAERFDGRLDTLFRTSMRMHVLAGYYNMLSGSLANVVELAVLGVGAWMVLDGNITIGTLFTFLFLVGQIIGPLQSMSNLLQLVQQATGSLQRVQELIEVQPELRDAPDATPLGRLAREVRLTHVFFSYDGGRLILDDVSLAIPAGANVAIVGPSGSGKSTVLSLLPRFYDPTRGTVTIDGRDLRRVTLASLRGQVGMVFQDTVLFNTSLRENIRLGNPTATDEQVEAAARAAELHELIVQLPDGYDTPVGERGGQLSGGQRQRVAIARAILRDPALLLLDEATSALDPATEAAINATLRRLSAGRTTVSVTHRLASVVGADRIFVMDQGRLVEQGTHAELLQADGVYARLWHEQHGELGAQPAGVEVGALQQIDLFAGLDQASLTRLAARLTGERHPAGQEIVSAGSVGDRLYVIAEGEVEVVAANAAGAPRRLALLGPGDHFGEIALLRDVPRTATVRARTPVVLYALTREDFQQLVATTPPLRLAVTQVVESREAALRELVASD